MATRREIALGRNLLVNAQRLNEAAFVMSQYLQDRHPGTGSLLGLTATDIKTEVAVCQQGIDDGLYQINQFALKYPIDTPILAWKETKSTFDADLADISAVKAAVDSSLSLAASKEQLATIGASIERSPNLIATGEPFYPPDVIGRLTTVNGVLDAISYELHGLLETTGQPSGKTFEQKKAYAESGIEVAELEMSFINVNERLPAEFGITPLALEQDRAEMVSALIYLWEHIRDCKVDKDLELLADYIDANVAKQPCVRRHWA